MADEDSATQSQSSRSSTPNVSNPSTPRQELGPEVRATPPLTATPSSSGVQRTIPGQAQPPPSSASMSTPTSHLAGSTPTSHLAGSTPTSHLAGPPLPSASSSLVAAAAMTTPPQPPHQLPPHQPQSKYSSLLAVIEDMGRDIRPTYAGNRTSSERLKRSIVHARILVRECLMECERSART